MTRTIALLFLLVFCSATVMQAQAQAPTPDPALKKFGVLVGHWTIEGEQVPGPLGPGGKYTGEFTDQMILGGFFYQLQWAEKGALGEVRGLEIDGYDPVNINFLSNWYVSDGSRFSGTLTVSGNTWTWAGKYYSMGKPYRLKDTLTFAPGLMIATEKGELSADGQTWTPIWENKWTKAKPAPKK
jgi:hypothetical protein